MAKKRQSKESMVSKDSLGRAVAIVTYSLENLNHSEKTLFGYALKGRKGRKGFADMLEGEVLGRTNVLVPLNRLIELEEFMATWKVEYKVRRFIELE